MKTSKLIINEESRSRTETKGEDIKKEVKGREEKRRQ